MQGIYFFTQLAISPLPLAFFNVIVEEEVGGEEHMRVGMLALVIFYSLAFLLCYVLNDEKRAKEQAEKTAHLRIKLEKGQKGTSKVAPDT